MAIITEKRLYNLEEELKALKATFKISGGMMKLYESVSPVFTITPEEVSYFTTVRFTPNYSDAAHLIIASIYYDFIDSDGTRYDFSAYARIIPQDNNYLLISTPTFEGSIQLKIVSNIPGTFTRI